VELEGRLMKKATEVQKLEEELEWTEWEHEAESSIFLGVVVGREDDWAQQLDHLTHDFTVKKVCTFLKPRTTSDPETKEEEIMHLLGPVDLVKV
jgi:hypothetical protein